MPMYFPDLVSIQRCICAMKKNSRDKRYTGIYPHIKSELPEARRQLGRYFREVWHDEIQAIEVEYAATKENYNKIMKDSIVRMMFSKR